MTQGDMMVVWVKGVVVECRDHRTSRAWTWGVVERGGALGDAGHRSCSACS